MTQEELTIAYMQEHPSEGITSLDAARELGIISFPKRICNLKKQGYEFKEEIQTVTNRYGKNVNIKRWWLNED